ncbi:hypothetical protein [Streptomyces sp. NPDC046197]
MFDLVLVSIELFATVPGALRVNESTLLLQPARAQLGKLKAF